MRQMQWRKKHNFHFGGASDYLPLFPLFPLWLHIICIGLFYNYCCIAFGQLLRSTQKTHDFALFVTMSAKLYQHYNHDVHDFVLHHLIVRMSLSVWDSSSKKKGNYLYGFFLWKTFSSGFFHRISLTNNTLLETG